MNVLVMGAGAVGGCLGGMLQASGNDVTLVARGAHLEALRAKGLELRRDGALLSCQPVRAVRTASEAEGEFELVLFTVKTYDTSEAAKALQPVVGPNTVVLTMQNGIDGVEELNSILGPEHVLAGTISIFAAILAAGVVEQTSARCNITLCETAAFSGPGLERIAETLRAAGAEVVISVDMRRTLWEKFLSLSVFATISSATDLPHGQVRALPDGLALYRRLITEACNLGRAAGVSLADDYVDRQIAFLQGLPPTQTSSMQHDYAAQHRVELEALTGSVVRRGQQLGVATPGFDVLYAVLKARAVAFNGLSGAPL